MFVLQLQASQYRNEPDTGRSYTGLHEPARHDLQYVWPDAQGDLIRICKNSCLQATLLFTSGMLTVCNSNMSRMILSDYVMSNCVSFVYFGSLNGAHGLQCIARSSVSPIQEAQKTLNK